MTVHVSIIYDKVSANTASSEPKTSEFQSGHRVVKKVLNILSLSMTNKVIECIEITKKNSNPENR